MKLQWLGFETDKGHASPWREKEATLREELSNFISETKRQTMEFCTDISVTKALRDFPEAFAVWVRDSLTLSNIDNLKLVYDETLKSVIEEHREIICPLLWLNFVEKVENECGSICISQLNQVLETVTKFIASIKHVFTDKGCFPCHAKLEEFGMGELNRICESLEENFVRPAVLAMCLELLSAFKVQNDRVQTAEKRYAKTFINTLLEEYNCEMGNYTGALHHAPCVLHAINSTLGDKFSEIFRETFPANKTGLQEIHHEQLQELRVRLGQAFYKHEATNQQNLEKTLPSKRRRFENLNRDCTGIIGNIDPASEALQDEKWIRRYMHESSRLEELLECEIQLAFFKDDGVKSCLQWKFLQSSLEMPLVFEEFQLKKRVTLENKTESASQATKKFFHDEMLQFITKVNSRSSTETFTQVHSTLVKKCVAGFQNLISAYLDSANISSQVEKLRQELSNTFTIYQTKFDTRLEEIIAELNKIVSNSRSGYVERMELFFKQHSNGLSLKVLQDVHDAAVAELKKLLEIEIKKQFKFEDPEVHWKTVNHFVDFENLKYVIKCNNALSCNNIFK